MSSAQENDHAASGTSGASQKRMSYSTVFKVNAIEQAERCKNITKVAKNLKITRRMLQKWIKDKDILHKCVRTHQFKRKRKLKQSSSSGARFEQLEKNVMIWVKDHLQKQWVCIILLMGIWGYFCAVLFYCKNSPRSPWFYWHDFTDIDSHRLLGWPGLANFNLIYLLFYLFYSEYTMLYSMMI